jgi:hypothetical protein
MVVFDGIEKTEGEDIVAKFKILPLISPGGTEDNFQHPQSE